VSEVKPLKPILKKVAPQSVAESESDSESFPEAINATASRGATKKLLEDNAEIAALEKKLGITGKKSKALDEDGLDWLADGDDSGSDDGFSRASKRKRPEDSKWLRDKRLKATGSRPTHGDSDSEGDEPDASMGELEDRSDEISDEAFDYDGSSVDDNGDDDFSGSDSATESTSDTGDAPPAQKKQRENPYVAPPINDSTPTAKYVPPSLRAPPASDEEALKQLRRQVQGLLNRLSEANTLSMLQSLEELYAKNARQYVTSVLVDLLIGLVADPSTLNDSYLILHAAFATAVYRVVGTDFIAHLLERLVEAFDYHRGRKGAEGKQTLNLLAYMSCLYNFQAIGSGLIFDYIRVLFEDLSEANTELLLRVVRTSGQQLRQDDPSSLKDIVLLLQRAVARIDGENMSVRTKFMIDTITDLKNNRMKAGAAASVVTSEQTTRTKKMLGSLSNSRSIKATEPLRVTLADIRDSEKKGKWWLVGASYLDPAKHTAGEATGKLSTNRRTADEDAGYESETPGSVNLTRLARTQGMNTDVRKAIFVAILSSSDHEEAYLRLMKLHLSAKQIIEIPRVLVHCVGAEKTYNPFYAVVAKQFCAEHKLRKAFEFNLWDAFGEMTAGEDDDEESGSTLSMTRLANLARFYGGLVASGGLDIRILKKLDLTYLQGREGAFMEVFLNMVFVQVGRNGNLQFETEIRSIFSRSAGVAGLPQGLRVFLETPNGLVGLVSGRKAKKSVFEGRDFAIEALNEAAKSAPVRELENDDDSE